MEPSRDVAQPTPTRTPPMLARRALAVAGLAAAVCALGHGAPWLLAALGLEFHLGPLKIGLIYVVIALGLNIVNGQAGQFSIGHAAFAGIGGYTAGAVTTMLGPRMAFWTPEGPPEMDSPGVFLFFVGALLAGGLTAALCGLLVGIPTLRLRGDYLAIATLGFGEIVRVVITNSEALGGPLGMKWIPGWSTPPVIALFVVLTIVVCRNIATSMPGRCLIALREDEIAAESLGISTTRTKVTAMAVSAGVAGLGGGLLAHHLTLYDPSMCGWVQSVEFVLMVVLGGNGSITGTAMAAVFLGMLPGEMLALTRYAWLQKVTGNKMVIYSLLLVALMLVRRQGLAGRWELSARWMLGVWRRAVGGARRVSGGG